MLDIVRYWGKCQTNDFYLVSNRASQTIWNIALGCHCSDAQRMQRVEDTIIRNGIGQENSSQSGSSLVHGEDLETMESLFGKDWKINLSNRRKINIQTTHAPPKQCGSESSSVCWLLTPKNWATISEGCG